MKEHALKVAGKEGCREGHCSEDADESQRVYSQRVYKLCCLNCRICWNNSQLCSCGRLLPIWANESRDSFLLADPLWRVIQNCLDLHPDSSRWRIHKDSRRPFS